jgi:hypothetical protein
MNLNEIFDTKQDVDWSPSEGGWIGKFTFDDKKFEILIDEYEALDKYSLVDFGFTMNGSWKVTDDQRSSGKILGVILHAFIEKIKELKPDCILFGVNFKNGSAENRKSLYDRISKLYAKGSSYHLETDWIKTKNGEYRILSRVNFSKEQLDKIDKIASSIESKS